MLAIDDLQALAKKKLTVVYGAEGIMEKGSDVHLQNIELLFPKAEEFEYVEERKKRDRLTDVREKKFLLVDDLRPNAAKLLTALCEILTKNYAVNASIADIRSLGGDYMVQMPKHMHERLAGQYDCVIVALAS